jgi:hypothetical protein
MIYFIFHISLLKSYKNKFSEDLMFHLKTAFLNENEE